MCVRKTGHISKKVKDTAKVTINEVAYVLSHEMKITDFG